MSTLFSQETPLAAISLSHTQTGIFPGKIAATVFSVMIELKEITKSFFLFVLCARLGNTDGALNFDI